MLVNKWLDNFAIELMYVFDSVTQDTYDLDYNAIKLNTELFDTINKKFCYNWTKVVFDENLQYSNITLQGEEVTGAYTYKFSDVNNKYKNLFGDNLDEKNNYQCSGDIFTIKDNLVYGFFETGWPEVQSVPKINKIVKYEDIYVLSIDMLDIMKKLGYEALDQYSKAETVIYEQDLIIAKFEMTLQKVGDNYIIKSLKKVK